MLNYNFWTRWCIWCCPQISIVCIVLYIFPNLEFYPELYMNLIESNTVILSSELSTINFLFTCIVDSTSQYFIVHEAHFLIPCWSQNQTLASSRPTVHNSCVFITKNSCSAFWEVVGQSLTTHQSINNFNKWSHTTCHVKAWFVSYTMVLV